MLRFLGRTALAATFLAVASVACLAGDAGVATTSSVGRPCSTSVECESGICIPKIGETISPTNKGVCSVACATSDACLAGWTCLATSEGRDLCQCGPSAEICDGRDNDCNGTIDDAPNGVCNCKTTVCDGACVDTMTSSAHCGGCGIACPPESICKEGLCACANGLDPCRDACTDTKSDSKNCGGCGVVCGEGSTCANGTCRCGADGSGDACAVATTQGQRTFCGLDGKCRTATTVVLTGCFGPESVISAPSGVVVTCHTGRFTDVFLLPNGGTPISCSSVESPLIATDGNTAFMRYYGIGLDLARCGIAPKTGTFPQGFSSMDAVGVGAGFAYWSTGGKLYRCPEGGCTGSPAEVAPLANALELDVDASGVYARLASGIIRIEPVAGTSTSVADIMDVSAVILDGDRLLFQTASGIFTCPKSGCGASPTPFVTQTGVSSLSADATRIWWKSGDVAYACAKNAPCTQPTAVLKGVSGLSFGADDASFYLVGSSAIERIPK